MSILRIWTIYDHPIDYHDCFIAREWDVSLPVPKPTGNIKFGDDLATIREDFKAAGRYCLGRNTVDDPVIVESWI